MERQRLGQDLADGHARIERRIGILEDDLRIAAEGAQFVGVQCEQIASLEANSSRIRLDQAQHQPADGGFAAAGFADQRQRLAGIDAEADAIDRLDERGRPAEHRPLGDEMLDQAFDLEQGASSRQPGLSSGALMQRDQCPGLTAMNGGGAATQASLTNGQRAAKRQPDGGLGHVGHHALDGGEMRGAPVQPRDRAEQADRIGMLG